MRGRPALKEGQRKRKIDVRFTEQEYQQILDLEKQLGTSRTELLRQGVLKEAQVRMVNAGEMISSLDQIGAELGRSGNNINQLAKYANTLLKSGQLSVQIIERFNLLLADYSKRQQILEVSLRKAIRIMGK